MPFADRTQPNWWYRRRLLCRYCKGSYEPRRGEPAPQLHCGEPKCHSSAILYRVRLGQEQVDFSYLGHRIAGEEVILAKGKYL